MERLPKLPPKPPSIIIERWMPYKQEKRKVVFEKDKNQEQIAMVKPKNLIITWYF